MSAIETSLHNQRKRTIVELEEKFNLYSVGEKKSDLNDVINLSGNIVANSNQRKTDKEKIEQQNVLHEVLKKLDFVIEDVKTLKSEFVRPQSNPKMDESQHFWIQFKNITDLVQTEKFENALKAINEIILNLDDDKEHKITLYTCFYGRAGIYRQLEMYEKALSDYDYLLQIPRLRLYHDEVRKETKWVECQIVQTILNKTTVICQQECIGWKENNSKVINGMLEEFLDHAELKKRNYTELSIMVWHEHAQHHYNQEEYIDSSNLALEALNLYPKEPEFFYIAAQSFFKLELFEIAKTFYQKIESLKIEWKDKFKEEIKLCDLMETEKILNQVIQLFNQKQIEEARRLLRKIDNFETLSSELKQKFLICSAYDSISGNKFHDAYTKCTRVLQMNEQNWQALVLRANVNVLLNKFEDALQDCNKIPEEFSQIEVIKTLRSNVEAILLDKQLQSDQVKVIRINFKNYEFI